jgi:hypothetical protein
MEFRVIKFDEGTVSLRSTNDILIVISSPQARSFSLEDRFEIEIDLKTLLARITSLKDSNRFEILVKANDIHDLRLPATHGTSRTPSESRLNGK